MGDRAVPLLLVRNPKARRYILRLQPDGVARVTVPRGGTIDFALNFAQRHAHWVEKQLQKPKPPPLLPKTWAHGTEVLLRGLPTALELIDGHVKLGDLSFRHQGDLLNLRPLVEWHLRRVITSELEQRTFELAQLHNVPVKRVTVRDQRSRWGSCSPRGTVSLNWRLVQTPLFVRDYIILHELMHLREMNHSARYWKNVEQVCPDYLEAEKWLRKHAGLLRT